MSSRAIERALQLLAASCVVAALGSNAGCWLRPCGGTVNEQRDTGTGAPLVAVSRSAAVDGRGRLFDLRRDGEGGWISFEHPIRDVFDLPENGVAVGDNGLILICEHYRSSEWTRFDSGTSADLTKIVELDRDSRIDRQLFALGPEVIVRSTNQGWRELPAPTFGWRGAQDIFVAADRLWVVADTTLWSAALPRHPERVDLDAIEWRMHAVDPDGPLIGGTFSKGGNGEPQLVIVFGARRLYRFDDGQGLRPIEARFPGELLEAYHGVIYSSSGAVWVGSDGVAQVEDDGLDDTITAVLVTNHHYSSNIRGTADGRVLIHESHHCKGGRPWIVDGRPRVATPASSCSDRWFAEALAEHASIASFAGSCLELLSLGAPARLIRATLAAQADELRHTQACLALARRHGVDQQPGALAI
ncbi:MAG TPA: hypothetical protein VK034_12965, partial [Enhygromyxa sp.]|nr:hypothetical protein [Enhygromyxa sp.]